MELDRLSIKIIMLHILKQFLNGSILERISDTGDSLTSYAEAEVNYSTAIFSKISRDFFVVIFLVALFAVFLTTLLISGTVGLMIILPEVYPEISKQRVFLYLGVVLGIILISLMAALIMYLAQIKQTFKEYSSHWKE